MTNINILFISMIISQYGTNFFTPYSSPTVIAEIKNTNLCIIKTPAITFETLKTNQRKTIKYYRPGYELTFYIKEIQDDEIYFTNIIETITLSNKTTNLINKVEGVLQKL